MTSAAIHRPAREVHVEARKAGARKAMSAMAPATAMAPIGAAPSQNHSTDQIAMATVAMLATIGATGRSTHPTTITAPRHEHDHGDQRPAGGADLLGVVVEPTQPRSLGQRVGAEEVGGERGVERGDGQRRDRRDRQHDGAHRRVRPVARGRAPRGATPRRPERHAWSARAARVPCDGRSILASRRARWWSARSLSISARRSAPAEPGSPPV